MSLFTAGFICGILTYATARWLDRKLTKVVVALLSADDTYGNGFR